MQTCCEKTWLQGWFFWTLALQKTHHPITVVVCTGCHVSDSNNINSNGRQAHYTCLSKRDWSYKNSHRKDNMWQSTAKQLGYSGRLLLCLLRWGATFVKVPQTDVQKYVHSDSCEVVKLINLSSRVPIAKFVSWLVWRILNRHTNHKLLLPCCCPLINRICRTVLPKQHHTRGRVVVLIISDTLGPLSCAHNRPAMKYDSNSSCVILLKYLKNYGLSQAADSHYWVYEKFFYFKWPLL